MGPETEPKVLDKSQFISASLTPPSRQPSENRCSLLPLGAGVSQLGLGALLMIKVHTQAGNYGPRHPALGAKRVSPHGHCGHRSILPCLEP